MEQFYNFMLETVEYSPNEQDFITLKGIWSKYKTSVYYNKSLKMKEFKSHICDLLGVDCVERKKIKGKTIRSPFVGWKFITNDDISK